MTGKEQRVRKLAERLQTPGPADFNLSDYDHISDGELALLTVGENELGRLAREMVQADRREARTLAEAILAELDGEGASPDPGDPGLTGGERP